MSDTVVVRFDKAVIARLLSNPEPQTIRLESMGVADADGSYSPTWAVESMDPALPEPWVFDGYRRIIDNGKPTGLWQARAVDLSDIEIEKGTGRMKASFLGGQGTTMVEARDALLEQLRPESGKEALRRIGRGG